jgi:hypothetical protein
VSELEDLSDHKAVVIKVKEGAMNPNAEEQAVYQISRPVMRAQSIQVLQGIVDSNNVEDTLKAFE